MVDFNLKKIRTTIKTREANIIINNLTSLTILQIANFIFPLITLPYLSRVLGVEKFGIIAYASAIIAYFLTFTEYGFDYTSVREIAKNKSNPVTISSIYYNTLYSRIVLTVVSFIILLLILLIFPSFYEYKTIIIYSFLIIPGNILTSYWFFQGMEDMKFITIMTFISKLIFTLFVFIIIKKESDYIYQPLIISISNFIVGLFSVYLINKKYNIKIITPKISPIKKELVNGFNMFVTNFIPTIYTQLNSIFLKGTPNGEIALGIYSCGNTFSSISYRILMVFSKTFYPLLARRMDKHKLYVYLSFGISLIISLILYIFSDNIIGFFYDSEFSESARVLKILSFTPIAMFLMNSYGINYIVLKSKERILSRIVIITSILGIILTLILINKYSYIGVAISSTLTQFLRGTIVFIYAKYLQYKFK